MWSPIVLFCQWEIYGKFIARTNNNAFLCVVFTAVPDVKQEIDSVCWTCMSGRCMLEFHKISCWMGRCTCHFNTNLKISFTTCCRTYTSNIHCLFLALGPGTESVLGPLYRNFLRRGDGVWRLTLPETIKYGVFEYNSCNIWLESGPLYSPGPVQLYPLYPP
jgi:hypothetical protein